jgi:hypothetical protein
MHLFPLASVSNRTSSFRKFDRSEGAFRRNTLLKTPGNCPIQPKVFRKEPARSSMLNQPISDLSIMIALAKPELIQGEFVFTCLKDTAQLAALAPLAFTTKGRE